MFPREPRASEPPELSALMAAYQRGDLAAFEGVYARLAPVVRRYLLSLARDADWTDDLVQDTFLQLHRSRNTYCPAYPVQPWAIAIARHVFLMGRRTRRRKGDFDREPVEDADRVPTRSHDAAVLARDSVHRGLAALSPGTRRVVWLHHVLGWRFEDVGARLGIRGAAAKLRASRGLALMRRTLRHERRSNGDKRGHSAGSS
jgi:RNA polymerase sigma-70 factor, ECF subfamily